MNLKDILSFPDLSATPGFTAEVVDLLRARSTAFGALPTGFDLDGPDGRALAAQLSTALKVNAPNNLLRLFVVRFDGRDVALVRRTGTLVLSGETILVLNVSALDQLVMEVRQLRLDQTNPLPTVALDADADALFLADLGPNHRFAPASRGNMAYRDDLTEVELEYRAADRAQVTVSLSVYEDGSAAFQTRRCPSSVAPIKAPKTLERFARSEDAAARFRAAIDAAVAEADYDIDLISPLGTSCVVRDSRADGTWITAARNRGGDYVEASAKTVRGAEAAATHLREALDRALAAAAADR